MYEWRQQDSVETVNVMMTVDTLAGWEDTGHYIHFTSQEINSMQCSAVQEENETL